MRGAEIKTLPIAVRVFPDPLARVGHGTRFWRNPEGTLFIHTQQLGNSQKLIGNYWFLVGGNCEEEGIFYSKHVSRTDLRNLRNFAARHSCRLLTQREFLQLFYELAYKARCLVVGFDLPVLFSRLAFSSAPARGFFKGGFSLCLWSYTDKNGRERLNGFRPRICIKYIDRKRSLIAFTARNSPDPEDLIPEGSQSGEPKPGYRFPGHFLDVRTLAFALADELYSLESACQAFGVEHAQKQT